MACGAVRSPVVLLWCSEQSLELADSVGGCEKWTDSSFQECIRVVLDLCLLSRECLMKWDHYWFCWVNNLWKTEMLCLYWKDNEEFASAFPQQFILSLFIYSCRVITFHFFPSWFFCSLLAELVFFLYSYEINDEDPRLFLSHKE